MQIPQILVQCFDHITSFLFCFAYVFAILCTKLDKAIAGGALWKWILYLTTLECKSFVFKERSCFESLYQMIQIICGVHAMVCLLKHRHHTNAEAAGECN